jgi:hypothetical protein
MVHANAPECLQNRPGCDGLREGELDGSDPAAALTAGVSCDNFT